MKAPEKHKVSLRGASAKEITRDELLEKAAQERALRSEARKAASAAQVIQRIWRGRSAACKAADRLRAEWDAYVIKEWRHQQSASAQSLSKFVLRPFLYFMGYHRFCLHKMTRIDKDHGRFVTGLKILLQSIGSPDSCHNFCSLSGGSKDEQGIWFYQVCKLVRLCCIALVEGSTWLSSDVAALASSAVRILVALTDASLWRTSDEPGSRVQSRLAVQGLLQWIAQGNADLYPAIRIYILQSCPSKYENMKKPVQFQKERFFVTASAITVALRPLHMASSQDGGEDVSLKSHSIVDQKQSVSVKKATEGFCTYILTIPFINQRIPAVILPALQHISVFTLCLEATVVSEINFHRANTCHTLFKGVRQPSLFTFEYKDIPPSAWVLANIVSLAACSFKNLKEGSALLDEFVRGRVLKLYVGATCSLLEQLLPWIDNLQMQFNVNKKEAMDEYSLCGIGIPEVHMDNKNFLDVVARRQLIGQLEPLYQQWHLRQLLECILQKPATEQKSLDSGQIDVPDELKLPDIACLYYNLLTVSSVLNSTGDICPVLNMLAFLPDFLPQLWEWLDGSLQLSLSFNESLSDTTITDSNMHQMNTGAQQKYERSGENKVSKWALAMSKLKGKASGADIAKLGKLLCEKQAHRQNLITDNCDIKALKKGPGGLSKEALLVFSIFCAAYGHLLMVLDDDEFYEQQVPFKLEQQRVIAASLNTLVYNGFFSASKQEFTSLMEMATKCLHSLYGRDCRRSFCRPSLWLAPAVTNRPPIAAAARSYEAALASLQVGEFSHAPGTGAVLTKIPHVFPFEERVQIFREFVKSEKMSRKMAGEVVGPGPGSLEIAIRRDHLVEDGFTQLNAIGSKFKSAVNVSFVNEHGLPEAGLDYGGLFKEFLTDLAKAAIDPGYGLFTQTATEERLLFPHPAAGNLGHGLQMIEFLGRIVGKALYEGILLDYSFSHVFVWKLLGRYSFLDDLSTLDPELHHSLMYLKRYDGDARDLALDFTVTEEILGRRPVVELIPGGAKVQVTNENKLHYVHAMADYKLNRQMQPLINSFAKGLSDLIAPAWLSLFNVGEFNQLLSGGEHDFDIDDLKENTRYTGGFSQSSRVIKNFWEVLKEFEPHERCTFLKFVTSCSRAPLLGFKHLQPAFTIHKVTCDTPVWAVIGGHDVERLPTASTCYNTLKLPTYKRISTLRHKLRYAIQCNAGFELS